jgi:hypothetical protein
MPDLQSRQNNERESIKYKLATNAVSQYVK